MANLLSCPTHFEEETVIVYPESKKTFLERSWDIGEADWTSKYVYACYDISPLAILDLTYDQIAYMELTNLYLLALSSITPSEMRLVTTRLLTSAPANEHKWVQVIVRFTNSCSSFSPHRRLFACRLSLGKNAPQVYVRSYRPRPQSCEGPHPVDLQSSSLSLSLWKNNHHN